MGNKAKEHVVKEITSKGSDLTHKSENLEEGVDTRSTMIVIVIYTGYINILR